MSGRRLVLLRHGRTAWNHEGRVQGQQDVGLDATGAEQALLVAPAIAALAPSVLWCSDLARTRETVAPVSAACGLAATYDPRLREFFFGRRETLTHAEYAEADPAGFEALRQGRYDDIPEAEPTAGVRARMLEVLGEVVSQAAPGATAVAVSHGAAIRVATAALLGWTDAQLHTLRGLDNCGWVVLVEDARLDGRLDGEGSAWRLQAYNRTVTAP